MKHLKKTDLQERRDAEERAVESERQVAQIALEMARSNAQNAKTITGLQKTIAGMALSMAQNQTLK